MWLIFINDLQVLVPFLGAPCAPLAPLRFLHPGGGGGGGKLSKNVVAYDAQYTCFMQSSFFFKKSHVRMHFMHSIITLSKCLGRSRDEFSF